MRTGKKSLLLRREKIIKTCAAIFTGCSAFFCRQAGMPPHTHIHRDVLPSQNARMSHVKRECCPSHQYFSVFPLDILPRLWL